MSSTVVGVGASRKESKDCQGDRWVTSPSHMGDIPRHILQGKSPVVECEEPTLDTGGAEHAGGLGGLGEGGLGAQVWGRFSVCFRVWGDVWGGFLFLNSCLGRKKSKFL